MSLSLSAAPERSTRNKPKTRVAHTFGMGYLTKKQLPANQMAAFNLGKSLATFPGIPPEAIDQMRRDAGNLENIRILNPDVLAGTLVLLYNLGRNNTPFSPQAFNENIGPILEFLDRRLGLEKQTQEELVTTHNRLKHDILRYVWYVRSQGQLLNV